MPILFFKPIFMKRIWGDNYFKTNLKYDLDDDLYGEMWSVSAVKNNETFITNDEYKGITLSEYFLSHKSQFGSFNEFPLLIKLIHTKDLLSVQVHPDNEYAKKIENCLGKTECWYFLDSKKDSFIYFGHHSKSKEELNNAINNGSCEDLLNKFYIKKDDFAYIPSKTIHALGKNLLLLEIQQSSDITYRLYDYNRLGLNGKPRELHINKALDVIDFNNENNIEIKNFKDKNQCNIVDEKFFKIYKFKVSNTLNLTLDNKYFKIISVIDGTINIDNHQLKLGESCVITNEINNVKLFGNGTILLTYAK